MAIDITSKPVPNSTFEVVQNNLEVLDRVVNQTSGVVTNRAGKQINTLSEIQSQVDNAVSSTAFVPVTGSFQSGGTIATRNDILLNTADNSYYSWGGALPKVVASGSTPASSGGLGLDKWVLRGDASLRSELSTGTASVKFSNGSEMTPSISFSSDIDTGIFRKAGNSLGISTTGVERVNVTATGRVGIGTKNVPVAGMLHVQNETGETLGILSRGFYEGSSDAPYVNNDVILCETYNKTISNSANRSWAVSCSNAYHDIPEGVTDSGTRVGVIGWAVSVFGRPGYVHRGTLDTQVGVWGSAGYQSAGTPSTAVINDATAVKGIVYADAVGATIKFARAGIFTSDGVTGGSVIEENAAIYARAQRGTISNYSFYGELGELYNQNLIFSPEKISGGTKYTQTNSPITARFAGNSFEFGYPDSNGYGSTLGATFSIGYPYIAFCAEADTTGDTFTTRGKSGTIILNLLNGATIYGRIVNSNASGQGVTEDMRHRADGKFAFDKNIMLASAPPATSTSAGQVGEISWDGSYFYVCVGVNTWKRATLSTW